jgi:hypothetical protein
MDQNSISYGGSVQIFKEGGGTGNPSLVAGSLAFNASTNVLTFTPSAAWVAGNYDVIIGAGVKDNCGNTLGSPFMGYFKAA